MTRPAVYRTLIVALLLAAIVGGSIALYEQYSADGGPLEIVLTTPDPTPTPQPGGEAPQKISINRAEGWLLEALPGIGPTLAQAIIDYRQTNGPFAVTEELLLVPGIGQETYDGVKDLIAVE